MTHETPTYFATVVVTIIVALLGLLTSANRVEDDFFYQKAAKYVDLHFKAHSNILESDKFVCEQYLAPSKWLDGGIGVFAGRKYRTNERIPPGVSFVFPAAKLPWAGDEEHVRNVVIPQLSTLKQLYGFSVYPHCTFLLIEDVEPGDELFNECGLISHCVLLKWDEYLL